MANNQLSRCQPLLGTYVEITLAGDASDSELIAISNAAFNKIKHVQAQMSFHEPRSELSRINRLAHRQPQPINQSLHAVIKHALQLSELSCGDYDISIASALVERGHLPRHDNIGYCGNWTDIELTEEWIKFHKPLQIDLGGIAKGYAVDSAMAQVPAGINATVNAGGDLCCNHWRKQKAHIRLPDLNRAQALEVPLKNRALATSASYYQRAQGLGSALINPHTNQGCEHTYSASVFADSCMVADSLTKAIFLNGDSDNSRALLRHFSASALLLNAAGELTFL